MGKTRAKVTPSAPQRILVVYGFDEHQKPRAAKFAEEQFELARKAAGLMKLQVFETEYAPYKSALAKIKFGNVYASGWGFVPNIQRKQYETLTANLRVPSKGYPATWKDIGVGHLVIAQEELPEDGWWEAIVTAVTGDILTLQWCINPDQPKAKRHRSTVALLPPTVQAAAK